MLYRLSFVIQIKLVDKLGINIIQSSTAIVLISYLSAYPRNNFNRLTQGRSNIKFSYHSKSYSRKKFQAF